MDRHGLGELVLNPGVFARVLRDRELSCLLEITVYE
jgi:hypothetical protein